MWQSAQPASPVAAYSPYSRVIPLGGAAMRPLMAGTAVMTLKVKSALAMKEGAEGGTAFLTGGRLLR